MPTAHQAEFERLVLCLYHEMADGEVHGLGNAVLVAAQGRTGLALTAAHNVAYLNRIAARSSPFGDLLRTREANPRFVSDVRGVLGHRLNGEESEVFSLPTFTTPTSAQFDIAVGLVTQRPGDERDLHDQIGVKLLPPEVNETVYVLGSHSHERIAATPEAGTSRNAVPVPHDRRSHAGPGDQRLRKQKSRARPN